MINWKEIKHFEQHEFDDPKYPGSGKYIDQELLAKLVILREETGWPMIMHGAVGGCIDVDGSHGHSTNSYHLKSRGCKAVDWHFKTNASTREQFYAVCQAGFTGVGIYYDWRWNGNSLPIGFHTDLRPKDLSQCWVRKNKEYFYLLK